MRLLLAPSHDLTPSLFHSWVSFWELRGGGSPGVGWGPLAWERRPRPAAQTPWHARRSCQDAGVGRPARGPGSAGVQLRGICCSCTNAIISFLRLLWLQARPGFSPRGCGMGLCPQVSRSPAGPRPTRCATPRRPQRAGLWLSVLRGNPQVPGLHPLPPGPQLNMPAPSSPSSAAPVSPKA